MRYLIEKTRAKIKNNEVEIRNAHVLQKGRSMVNENVAGILFHTPSLFELITLKVYVPGGKLEKVVRRSLEGGDQFFSIPSRI